MDNIGIPKKYNEWKSPWKKACVKTTSEMGGLYGEGLLFSAGYKKTGQGYVEVNY
jgi:hypothetical protein